MSTVRWKARSSEACTTPSLTAILAESAIKARVKAASLPPGSQLSGSSTLASEPATPVRLENDPTTELRRSQTDTALSDLERTIDVGRQMESVETVTVVCSHGAKAPQVNRG